MFNASNDSDLAHILSFKVFWDPIPRKAALWIRNDFFRIRIQIQLLKYQKVSVPIRVFSIIFKHKFLPLYPRLVSVRLYITTDNKFFSRIFIEGLYILN